MLGTFASAMDHPYPVPTSEDHMQLEQEQSTFYQSKLHKRVRYSCRSVQ